MTFVALMSVEFTSWMAVALPTSGCSITATGTLAVMDSVHKSNKHGTSFILDERWLCIVIIKKV